jgi:antiviral helicase SKI2
MGYLDTDRVVTMKGRVACEINSGDELVATELIFGGVLSELSPPEAVALLSALVFQEKTDVEPALPPRLQQARDDAVALAFNAGTVQQACGLDLLPEDFVLGTLKFGLMEVVYEWAQGTPFKEVMGLTDVMEGSIVRAMVRLDETCREFRDAARVMGNTALYKQMEEASGAITRDVIFAASLYVA